jgi:hypothetical protein
LINRVRYTLQIDLGFSVERVSIDYVPLRRTARQYLRKHLPLIGIDQQVARQFRDVVGGGCIMTLDGESGNVAVFIAENIQERNIISAYRRLTNLMVNLRRSRGNIYCLAGVARIAADKGSFVPTRRIFYFK